MMIRCPACRSYHDQDLRVLARALRAALSENVEVLRNTAKRVALELAGYCSPCAFLACIGGEFSPEPKPRPFRVVRALEDRDERTEREYLDGFESAEVGFRPEYLCIWPGNRR